MACVQYMQFAGKPLVQRCAAGDASTAATGSPDVYFSNLFVCLVQAQELIASATLQVDFRHVESFDAELAGLIQQHHYRVELGLRQVTCCLPSSNLRTIHRPIV